MTPTGTLRVDDGGKGPVCPGDWVIIGASSADGDHTVYTVRGVLERRSCLMRSGGAGSFPQTLAANMDEVWIVVPVDQPAEPSRLERLLTLAWDSGAAPVVVLTKSDLANEAAHVQAVRAAGPDASVMAVSSVTGRGIEALRARLGPGRSAALMGVSGAGKSSLINALVGTARQPTGAVRAGDGRGRHTTTWRQLVAVPGGGAIIDTPGLRSLGLWLDGGGVDATFSDVVDWAGRCHFTDCRHTVEPGCAVRSAISGGALLRRRLDHYVLLRHELSSVAERNEARMASSQARRRPAALEDSDRHRRR